MSKTNALGTAPTNKTAGSSKQKATDTEAAVSEALSPRDRQLAGLKLWKKGESGNPAGAVGSRNRLGEEFLKDMLAMWEQHGIQAIRKVAKDKPDGWWQKSSPRRRRSLTSTR